MAIYIGFIFYKQKTLQKGYGTDLESFTHMIHVHARNLPDGKLIIHN